METENIKPEEQQEKPSERDLQIQASFIAQNLLIAEIITAYQALLQILTRHNLLTPEMAVELQTTLADRDMLQQYYQSTDQSFMERYQRIRYAWDHPEEVEAQMKAAQAEKEAQQTPRVMSPVETMEWEEKVKQEKNLDGPEE